MNSYREAFTRPDRTVNTLMLLSFWRCCIEDFISDCKGSIGALVAILLPIILGSVTLGLDHMRATQQVVAMQRAADAAALTSARQFSFLSSKGGNSEGAVAVGKAIAEKAKQAGIDQVAFDRSGYRYHGRVKALAEAAREGGLKF